MVHLKDIVKVRNKDGSVFSCKCGSHEFTFVGYCGDSGDTEEAIDCTYCKKAWCVRWTQSMEKVGRDLRR